MSTPELRLVMFDNESVVVVVVLNSTCSKIIVRCHREVSLHTSLLIFKYITKQVPVVELLLKVLLLH